MLESFLFFFLLFLLRCVRNPRFSHQVHSAKMHCERGKGTVNTTFQKTKRAFLTQFGTELVLSHIVVFSKMSRRIWDAKKRHLPIGLSIAITQIVRAPSLLLACLAGSSSSPFPSSPSACYPRSQMRCANFFPPPYFSHLEIWGPGIRVSMALVILACSPTNTSSDI